MPSDPLACLPAIDRCLDELTRVQPEPAPLRDAVRYALLGGGKRIRPVLAWNACVATGGRGPECLPAAAAVEMVHAFSLVHDDLPALDNDDLRRGRPTLHVHAGEAMAILAGDALLALAFEVLAAAGRHTPGAASSLVEELSRATAAMIAGQVEDTLGASTESEPDLARVRRIHSHKTGALIRAACRMGARCAPACTGAALEAVTGYADAAGLMFQIVDDLLDVEGTHEQTGKRTRKDADAGKLSYPRIVGVERSREEVENLRKTAHAAVEPLGAPAEGLRALADLLAARRH